MIDPHEKECALAAIAARLELPLTMTERRELRALYKQIANDEICCNLPFKEPPNFLHHQLDFQRAFRPFTVWNLDRERRSASGDYDRKVSIEVVLLQKY